MDKDFNSLGVIGARGGSKGLPGKNVRLLAGKPLIAHTISASQESRLLDRIIVSTDDPVIADVAREYGGDVPFLRPSHLAQDSSRIIDVLRHAVDWAEEENGLEYTDVVLLQPTSPLHTGSDIDESLERLRTTGCDSVITVYRHSQIHPSIMYTVDDTHRATRIVPVTDSMASRQELSPVYIRTGLVYAFQRRLLREAADIYGSDVRAIVIPPERAIDINDEFDFEQCELFLSSENDRLDVSR